MNDIEKDPNFWHFLTLIWKDHPLIFVLLVVITWGGIGAIRTGSSFIEFWINGFTPVWLRKRRHLPKKESQDDKHGEISKEPL